MHATDREADPEVPKVWPPVPTATDVVRLPRPVLWLLVAAVVALGAIAWAIHENTVEQRAWREAEWQRVRRFYYDDKDRNDQEPHPR